MFNRIIFYLPYLKKNIIWPMMDNSSNTRNNINTRLLFIIFLVLIAWVHLTLINNPVLHPWDDGLYAVSVKYIVDTHHLLDQTAGPVAVLYSSSHPPLQLCLSAATSKPTGLNLSSLRLWPLLFSLRSPLPSASRRFPPSGRPRRSLSPPAGRACGA